MKMKDDYGRLLNYSNELIVTIFSQEQARLEAERRLLHREAEKQSMAGSDRPDFYRRDEWVFML